MYNILIRRLWSTLEVSVKDIKNSDSFKENPKWYPMENVYNYFTIKEKYKNNSMLICR